MLSIIRFRVPTNPRPTANHADEFHPFLGPLLMVSYALLSNTLLLTVLVAILGNTFATINADAAAEVSSMTRICIRQHDDSTADAAVNVP